MKKKTTYKSFVDVKFEEFVHILVILYSMEVYQLPIAFTDHAT